MNTFAILSNLPRLDHERFGAHRELEEKLRATLRGEVHFDMGHRALYAADSSNYRQLPIGVILPRDAADVEAALAACRATGAAVLPRGSTAANSRDRNGAGLKGKADGSVLKAWRAIPMIPAISRGS